jgi:hypothetical protein
MKKILIILILLVSCKPQQITVTKTEYQKDTIYVEKVVKINVPQTQIVEIESPCDSLGVLKPFKTTLKSDKVNVSIVSKDGKLTATINLDSIKEVYQKEFQSSVSNKVEIREVKIKQPLPKWIWYSLGINLVLLIWTFKKQIFGLASNMFPALKVLKIAKWFI